MKKTAIQRFIWLGLLCLMAGCHDRLLDAKPDQALIIPETLDDFQSLLDNLGVFNTSTGLVNIAADEWHITTSVWQNLTTPQERNGYIWATDVYETNLSIADWRIPYEQVFYSNVILEGLAKINANDDDLRHRHLQGAALFCRAFAFYNLAQLFCAPYLDEASGQLPGIPLRLAADVNLLSVRGTVAGTYTQLLEDLHRAIELLPDQAPYKSRPTRVAGLALLARIYQSMNDHARALTYADQALALQHTLLDYNLITHGLTQSMPRALPNGNDEVLYYACLTTYIFNANPFGDISPAADLQESYAPGDLRDSLYYATHPATGKRFFRGSYTGEARMFSGLATDELYLIRAESLARLGADTEAMEVLNSLLEKRIHPEHYVALAAETVADLVGLVLAERRKSLVGRGTRWSDLRRLNADPDRAKTVLRELDGQVYRLDPGSNRYLFPIPDLDIQAYGLSQNPR